MERKVRRQWSAEARARHKEGCEQYQRERQGNMFVRGIIAMARESGVTVGALCKALVATDKEKLNSIAALESREARIQAVKDLTLNTSEGVPS